MRTRTLAVVGFALLLTLSGCSALDGSSPDGTGPDSVTYPDGAGPEGFTNTSQVLTSHQDVLSEDSYRLSYNLTYTLGQETASTSTVVTSNQSQSRQLLQVDVPTRSVDQFTTAEMRAARVRTNDNVTYHTQPAPGPMSDVHHQGARPGDLLTTVVATGNYTATGTETRQGRTAIIYEANSTRANASGQVPDQIERYNATVAIDEDGRILEATLTAAGQTNGTAEVYDQAYRTASTGDVTVQRPAWVSNATA